MSAQDLENLRPVDAGDAANPWGAAPDQKPVSEVDPARLAVWRRYEEEDAAIRARTMTAVGRQAVAPSIDPRLQAADDYDTAMEAIELAARRGRAAMAAMPRLGPTRDVLYVDY